MSLVADLIWTNVPVARLHVAPTPASKKGKYQITLTATTSLDILNLELFANYLQNLFMKESVTSGLVGNSSVTVSTCVGTLTTSVGANVSLTTLGIFFSSFSFFGTMKEEVYLWGHMKPFFF